jgi:RHS repeat-associated protein
MNKLALYLITLLGLCLTQPMAHAMSVQWTDYGYDNNGNVTELYDGDSGEIVGQYEYDPYGNTIKAEGQAARENNIRFSTKEYDSSTGLYYYGYRYYDPTTGRWPSRDPIEERGGLNLYGFVNNDGVDQWDYLGLEIRPQWVWDGWTEWEFYGEVKDSGWFDLTEPYSVTPTAPECCSKKKLQWRHELQRKRRYKIKRSWDEERLWTWKLISIGTTSAVAAGTVVLTSPAGLLTAGAASAAAATALAALTHIATEAVISDMGWNVVAGSDDGGIKTGILDPSSDWAVVDGSQQYQIICVE